MVANRIEGGHELTRGNRPVLKRGQLHALVIGSCGCEYCVKHSEAHGISGQTLCEEYDLIRVVFRDTLTCRLFCARDGPGRLASSCINNRRRNDT